MKETVRQAKKESSVLSENQIQMLQSVGRLISTDYEHVAQYLPPDPSKPMYEWVFNTGGILVVGDLNFNFAPREIVYLPKFFDKDKINSSPGLRNAVHILKQLRPIKDPTVLTKEDLKPEKSVIESLPRGEHDVEDTLLKKDEDYENPMIEGLIKFEEDEKAAQERMGGKVKVGEERRRNPKKSNKTEE